MNKKAKVFTIIGAALSCTAIAIGTSVHFAMVYADTNTCFVDFFNNYAREEFELSNGFNGKGDNLIYKTVQVNKNSLVEKPTDPTRKYFDFLGWYKEEECEHEWNFNNEKIVQNTRLFAKWEIAGEDEKSEPPYTPPSTVLDDSASEDYVIDSIMYFKVENGVVKLPTAGIIKLSGHSDNVLPFMEYRVKANKTITAIYEDDTIKVTCGDNTTNITVKNDSTSYIISNSNYESKTKNYEANALEEDNYHVMLAGSSSIEFWTTYQEDMDPIVCYNHGIGGTTIEQWDNYLNQRLVFPYKPKMVVYYVGINNVINSKESADAIYSRLEIFFNNTHNSLPDTKVQYIMMNLIPGYKSYFNTINSVNDRIRAYQANNTWLTLINPGVALLKQNGEPNAAYFRTDGLHLSYYGYVIWGGIIKQSIIDGLETN